jgi:hypothetical protein
MKAADEEALGAFIARIGSTWCSELKMDPDMCAQKKSENTKSLGDAAVK